jgi:hypothetical protein
MQERIITYSDMNHLDGWALCGINFGLKVADGREGEFGRVDALPPQQKHKWKSSTQHL